MWINPNDSDNFLLLDDGGAVVTFDRGKTWSVQSNQPTAQFYRLNVDNQFPYRIYAAQQDNSSIVSQASWSPRAAGSPATAGPRRPVGERVPRLRPR